MLKIVKLNEYKLLSTYNTCATHESIVKLEPNQAIRCDILRL